MYQRNHHTGNETVVIHYQKMYLTLMGRCWNDLVSVEEIFPLSIDWSIYYVIVVPVTYLPVCILVTRIDEKLLNLPVFRHQKIWRRGSWCIYSEVSFVHVCLLQYK